MPQGPEAKLIKKMRDAGRAEYGERLVITKYHGSQFGEAGVSDLLCCLDGVFVAVEAKVPTGKVTVKQQAYGQRIMRAGGVFAVCRTVEEFMDALEYVAWVGCQECTAYEECATHAAIPYYPVDPAPTLTLVSGNEESDE
jgi:hypothetical protein